MVLGLILILEKSHVSAVEAETIRINDSCGTVIPLLKGSLQISTKMVSQRR